MTGELPRQSRYSGLLDSAAEDQIVGAGIVRSLWLSHILIGCVVWAACGMILSSTHTVRADPIPATLPASGELDEAFFLRGLRERGLDTWYEQHLADHPPRGPIEVKLREREQVLAKAMADGRTLPERQALMVEAYDLLHRLLVDHPEYAFRYTAWLTLAEDALDRCAPGSFERLILYESRGLPRREVAHWSRRAVEALATLQREIAAAWSAIGEMEEADFDAAQSAGRFAILEEAAPRAEWQLMRARVFQAVSLPEDEAGRSDHLLGLANQIVRQSAWLDPASVAVEPRARMLWLAAWSARLGGDLRLAEQCIHACSQTLAEPGTPTDRGTDELRLWAVLERARFERDAGRIADARQTLQAARDQLARSSLGSSVVLATAWCACTLNVTAADGTWRGSDVLSAPQALRPLTELIDQDMALRESAYAALAGTLTWDTLPAEATPWARLLTCGATLRQLSEQPPGADRTRDAAALADAVVGYLAGSNAQAEPAPDEWTYLQARAYGLANQPDRAVDSLLRLGERHPRSERALEAALQAVELAQSTLSQADPGQRTDGRRRLMGALRQLRAVAANTTESRTAAWALGQLLEQDGQWREAAAIYAEIAADDPRHVAALQGRARCLYQLLEWAHGEGQLAEPDQQAIAAQAVEAARAAKAAMQQTAADGTAPPACATAQAWLLLACVLNHDRVRQNEAALQVLEEGEAHWASCPTEFGQALYQRIRALQRLGRLSEAQAVVEDYLAADPESAGPVMAGLLEGLRAEAQRAHDRDDDRSARRLADEVARLAARLLEWAKDRPGRVSPMDLITIRTWRAWAVLDSGQPREAGELFAALAALSPDRLPADAPIRTEIDLGRATVLLDMDQPAEALPIFQRIWRSSPEYTSPWWRTLAGSLCAHDRLKADPQSILSAIAQQRSLAPDLGGPYIKRQLEGLEARVRSRLAAATSPGS